MPACSGSEGSLCGVAEEDGVPCGVSGSLMRALNPFTARPVRPQPLPATPPPGTNTLALEFQRTAFGSTNVQITAGVGCSTAFPPLVSGWDFTVWKEFPRVCLPATVWKDEDEGPHLQIRKLRPREVYEPAQDHAAGIRFTLTPSFPQNYPERMPRISRVHQVLPAGACTSS